MKKILYAASNYSHIKNFHLPYINYLKESNMVDVLSSGNESDINVPFKKKLTSIKNIFLIFQLRKVVKNYDVLILNTSLCAFILRMALKLTRKKPLVINIVHGYLFSLNSKKMKDRFFLLLEKMVRKQTDYILTMNEEDNIIAKKYHLAKKEVMSINGIGIPSKKDEEMKNPFDLQKFNLLYVAELSKRKNQQFILDNLLKIKSKIENVHITFVGDGKERNKYEKFVKKNHLSDMVTFTGYLGDPFAYYKYCDIYLSPSKIEGLPFNVLHAIDYNKIALCSNIKGHRDIEKIDHAILLYNDKNDFINQLMKIKTTDLKIDGSNTFNKFERMKVVDENIKLLCALVD